MGLRHTYREASSDSGIELGGFRTTSRRDRGREFFQQFNVTRVSISRERVAGAESVVLVLYKKFGVVS